MLSARFSQTNANARRARIGETLTDDQIRQVAPSVFAAEAHDSRSARYAYIPTSEIVAGMRANGFAPVFAAQSRARDVAKREHTKHMLRFRHVDALTKPTELRVGATFPEIVLVNSHDGTSSYHIMSGLFRLACLNGLVVAAGDGDEVKVPHKGNITDLVIDGSYTVLSESRRAMEIADDWTRTELSRDEQHAYAEAAHMLRWEPDQAGNSATPIRPAQLLLPRRNDDRPNDLWTVTNRVQENAIRGGLTAIGRDANNRPRRVTSREVQGIDQNTRLNRALWLLSERMAELKGAARLAA